MERRISFMNRVGADVYSRWPWERLGDGDPVRAADNPPGFLRTGRDHKPPGHSPFVSAVSGFRFLSIAAISGSRSLPTAFTVRGPGLLPVGLWRSRWPIRVWAAPGGRGRERLMWGTTPTFWCWSRSNTPLFLGEVPTDFRGTTERCYRSFCRSVFLIAFWRTSLFWLDVAAPVGRIPEVARLCPFTRAWFPVRCPS